MNQKQIHLLIMSVESAYWRNHLDRMSLCHQSLAAYFGIPHFSKSYLGALIIFFYKNTIKLRILLKKVTLTLRFYIHIHIKYGCNGFANFFKQKGWSRKFRRTKVLRLNMDCMGVCMYALKKADKAACMSTSTFFDSIKIIGSWK